VRAIKTDRNDVLLLSMPFAHIAGPDILGTALLSGCAVVLIESFVPEETAALCTRHGVTIAVGSTAFYQGLLTLQRERPDAPVIPTVRALMGGGAPKPPEIYFQVRRELGPRITHGYGMTECPMISTGTPEDTDEQLAYTDGAPVDGCEIAVRAADGTDRPPGADGEIWVRGPMLFHGYTDDALNGEAFDDEGFFRTGDVGRVRDDGHIVITDRVKDVIIRKGENISAREVEDLLYEHDAVAAVAVIGLPDVERGERVCAVVELVADAPGLTLADVQAHCRAAGLTTQKIPEQLELVTEFPRNATLKILKPELRRRYADPSGVREQEPTPATTAPKE
jgi:cyclohexanecarboxylate-CoA ligase